MSESIFQVAYDRARGKFSDDAWFSLNPRQITEAIYQEIRQLDAERVGVPADPLPAGPRAGKGMRASRGPTRRASARTALV